MQIEISTRHGGLDADQQRYLHDKAEKLLKYFGPANVCWGTKGIVDSGVQAQIEAFRAFTITPQYQEKYGYPALTPAIKAQIFGLNAARIYRVDPCAPRCTVTSTSFA